MFGPHDKGYKQLIDEEAIARRAANAIKMAISEFEVKIGRKTTDFEKELALYIFQRGMAQGVLEVTTINKEVLSD